jgi:hypothetical protein
MELAASLSTAYGKIICLRCQAMSKRTRLQCGAPAKKSNRLRRFHGSRKQWLENSFVEYFWTFKKL